MRRRQIEVIRYRRVTITSGSDRELNSIDFPVGEAQQVIDTEAMNAQRPTRTQRLAISGQRLLNHLRSRRGNYSTKSSTIDRDRRTKPR